jgi:hypothetical protein
MGADHVRLRAGPGADGARCMTWLVQPSLSMSRLPIQGWGPETGSQRADVPTFPPQRYRSPAGGFFVLLADACGC